MSEIKPKARQSEIVVQEFGNEILIYDLVKNKAFSLNETSSDVWQLCDGTKSIKEISTVLTQRHKKPVLEDVVWFAMEQLKKNGLIEKNTEFQTPFAELTRREAVRKIGATSMVALPVILSLVAPTAIRAGLSTCSTAAPGGTLCRCLATDVPNVGDNCGTNFVIGDICNGGCICQRSAAACPPGPFDGVTTAGTCQGMCVVG